MAVILHCKFNGAVLTEWAGLVKGVARQPGAFEAGGLRGKQDAVNIEVERGAYRAG